MFAKIIYQTILKRRILMSFGTVIVFVINLGLIYFFSGSIYPVVGILYTTLALILTITLSDTKYCYGIINVLVRNWRKSKIIGDRNGNSIMLSAAFLIGAMKIGAVTAMFVEFGAIVILALAILIASGFLFDGYKSGMTISGAFFIAKILIKIANFFYSIFDKIMELVVKIEFKILGIEQK